MSIDENNQSEMSGADTLIDFFKELGAVSENPRSLIIITNAFLEILIHTLIKEHLRTADIILGNNQAYPYSVRITFVQEAGLLPESLCEHLRRFNSLRNEAAHDIRFFGKAETTTYISDKVNALVQYYGIDPASDLSEICRWISLDTWNKHPGFFMKMIPSG